jgi:hypothetical protein
MFRGVLTLYFGNNTEHINAELLNAGAVGMYNNHSAVKG